MFQLKGEEIPPCCLNPNISCALARWLGPAGGGRCRWGQHPGPVVPKRDRWHPRWEWGLHPQNQGAPIAGQTQPGDGVSRRNSQSPGWDR